MNNIFENDLEYFFEEKYIKHPFFNFIKFYIEKKSNITYVNIIKFKEINLDINIKVIYNKMFELIMQNSIKTLIIDLNQYSNLKKNCKLTSETIYFNYINELTNEKYLTLLEQRYPLMFEQIKKEIKFFIKFYEKFLIRLNRDIKNIKKIFSIKGNVKNIELGKGDSHCKQNQVLRLIFECGSIVYKPKNIDINIELIKMVDYLKNNGFKNIFNIPKTLAKNNYGWEEYIEFKNTKNIKDINNIYNQYGTLACISYLFNISDLHAENLIINNKQLYLIDTESLFQKNINNINVNNVTDKIYVDIKESVISTMLFPTQICKSNNVDSSGITGKSDQIIKKGQYQLINKYTSKMKMIRTDYLTKYKTNIPIYKNQKIEPRNYTNDIIKGFIGIYKYISSNKSAFIDENGIINNYSDFKTRVIMRNTSDYSKVLGISRNPKYLINKKVKQDLFNKMWEGCKYNKNLNKIVSSEINDLNNGDIPYFYSYPNSCIIYNSKNKKCTKFKNQNMLKIAKKKIISMNENQMINQIKLIKISMAKPVKKWELGKNGENYNLYKYKFNENYSNLLENVIKITDNIVKNSILYNEIEMSWINIDISENKQWIISPFDFSLYNGLSGNIILFATLFEITKINKYKKYEKMCINSLNKVLENTNINSLSAFWGIGSLVYLYYNLGLLHNETEYKEISKNYLLKSKNLINKENNLDFISGIAGYLVICCNIYEKEKNKNILEIIQICANKIINAAIKVNDNEIGWYSDIQKGEFLNGFSHGLAGISYSLIKAYSILKDDIYLEYCKKAINLENKHFINKNWIDLRNRKNRIKKGFPDPVYWCHGAAGIGMSRLKVLEHCTDNLILNDIKNAINTTLQKGFNGIDCLCHGALGNIELLISASIVLENNIYKQKAIEIINDINDKNLGKWMCGIPQEIEVYSFMTGLSGIAYELLRMLNPNLVPSVLTLDFSKTNLEKNYEK